MKITIPGKPRGKERPRFSRTGKVYTPCNTRTYESIVGWHAKAAMQGKPYEGDVEISIRLYYDTLRKPDIDNVCKALLDSMQGIVYKNDSQITKLEAVQILIDKEQGTRAEIEIKEACSGN